MFATDVGINRSGNSFNEARREAPGSTVRGTASMRPGARRDHHCAPGDSLQ